MADPRDTIRIDNLKLTLPIADDDASDEKCHAQTVHIDLDILHDVFKAAHADDLAYSINYSAVHAALVDALPKTRFASLEALADSVFETLFHSQPAVAEARVVVTQDGSPRFTVETTRRRDQPSMGPCKFVVGALTFDLIIGVNARERTEKQPVAFDIEIDGRQRGPQERFPFSNLSTSIHQTFAPSTYLTVEALASAVARHVLVCVNDPETRVTIKLSKPNALTHASSAQIHITRPQNNTADGSVAGVRPLPPLTTSGVASGLHSASLALGSNLGDRFANIETALRLLEAPRSLLDDLPEDAQMSVVDTSFMYETTPMYVTDQPRFANCACLINTSLPPKRLLHLAKEVETVVGRVPSVRFGPRAVDIDIIFYDCRCVDTRRRDDRANLDNLIGELVIPHPRMCEREFVLRPLNDMIPNFVHPACNKTMRVLLDELVSTRAADDFPMFKVMPFPKYPLDANEGIKIANIHVPPTAKYWTLSSVDGRPTKTYLMATLNVTPDSFSDGAQYDTLPTALAYTATAVASGADIIDIGGYSTRPRADHVSTEDELARVLPVIHAIRTHSSNAVRQALLSIDTFRWEVASQAVHAGANCINDVHAFTGPTYPPDATSSAHLARMREVARTLGVPVVLMHSRGDAGAHKDYSAYDDAQSGGLVSAVQTELGGKVDAIVRGPGGVRRWLVFVDPGIGFSKPVEGQLALMRDLGRVTAPVTEDEDEDEGRNALAGYPMLVGPSKKSIWGAVLERGEAGRETTAQERGWATAAAVACAVQQRANVVRVHDVPEMRDVVAIATAIWNC